ncbi:predicted protein [Aspergillus terreus NIH2624]|uniref:Uncharacterized protein n=1 Tax=Aspergillus terreus (strain NIH 2624 / FGSC A1156) TaxID=341663 RepID=Q0D0I8_ASPTN|nr:uncharacterized protein ATEG_00546 [Aspergillus terreus NIH2624]EAU39192.1 predicted protein [Aspergillus terreus NIH2624]
MDGKERTAREGHGRRRKNFKERRSRKECKRKVCGEKEGGRARGRERGEGGEGREEDQPGERRENEVEGEKKAMAEEELMGEVIWNYGFGWSSYDNPAFIGSMRVLYVNCVEYPHAPGFRSISGSISGDMQ